MVSFDRSMCPDRTPDPEALAKKLEFISRTLSEIEDWLEGKDRDRASRAHEISTILSTLLARRELSPDNLESYLSEGS